MPFDRGTELPRLFLGCAAVVSLVGAAAFLLYLDSLFSLELWDLCGVVGAYREACDAVLLVLSVALHLLWFYCTLL